MSMRLRRKGWMVAGTPPVDIERSGKTGSILFALEYIYISLPGACSSVIPFSFSSLSMALHDSTTSTRFYPDVSAPSQPSSAHHDVCPSSRCGKCTPLTHFSQKCNASQPPLYPSRSPLAHRQNGLRGENAAGGFLGFRHRDAICLFPIRWQQ